MDAEKTVTAQEIIDESNVTDWMDVFYPDVVNWQERS